MDVDIGDNVSLEDSVDKSKSAKEKMRNDMLDYLSKSKEAHFKSQQIGDPELLESEKRGIAETILDRNCGTFLARFGNYILEEHLEYFNECPDDQRYEVDFYLKSLRATHNSAVNRVKVRNRRFEALKKLVEEGSYFSEYEMKKRNPLLYEQLVGQFLTEEEEKERTGIDTTNITFVNLLLEQYDRDQMKKLKERQEEDEDNQKEEEDNDNQREEEDDDDEDDFNDKYMMNVDSYEEDIDSDENECFSINKKKSKAKNRKRYSKSFDSMDDDDDKHDYNGSDINKSLWGEEMTEKSQPRTFPSSSKVPVATKDNDKKIIKRKVTKIKNVDEEEDELTDEERNLLMEEFRSNMFNSFLEGKDTDFDYHEVDDNSDYDDIDMRDEDEQDKYFNSESPTENCENETTITSACEVTKEILSGSVPVNKSTDNLNGDTVNSVCCEDYEEIEINNYITSLNTDNITSKMENLHH